MMAVNVVKVQMKKQSNLGREKALVAAVAAISDSSNVPLHYEPEIESMKFIIFHFLYNLP